MRVGFVVRGGIPNVSVIRLSGLGLANFPSILIDQSKCEYIHSTAADGMDEH